jgi:hypothetical protein
VPDPLLETWALVLEVDDEAVASSVPGGAEHVSGTHHDLTAANALHLLVCALASALGHSPEASSALPSTER